MTTLQFLITSVGILLSLAVAYALLGRWQKARRKSRFVEYGFEVVGCELPSDGWVEIAHWQHPREKRELVSQQQVDAIRKFIRPGDTAIDIGAFTGDTTVPMALAAGRSGCVIALEPNPHVFKVLAKNAKLNCDKTNIVPLNIAATESDGTFTFNYCDASFCNGGFLSTIKNQRHNHPYKLEVTGKNLPALLLQDHPDRLSRLSLIKVDAEGYDRHVLLSLRPLIEKYRPTIICEVYKRLDPMEREALYDVLEAYGYASHKLGQSDLQGELLGRSSMQRWKHFDILAVPKERSARAIAA